MWLILLSVSVLWLCPQAHGYFVGVDAHAEECFFDRVSSGMKMSLTFEVVDGGFLDIDVKVSSSTSLGGETAPGVSGASLMSQERSSLLCTLTHVVCFN